MSFDDLRDAALGVHFDLAGVDVTITRPELDALPVSTRGMWLSPLDEPNTIAKDLSRLDPRRVLVLQRNSSLPEFLRESVIQAAELEGGTVLLWKVDGFEQSAEPDLIRVLLRRVPAV